MTDDPAPFLWVILAAAAAPLIAAFVGRLSASLVVPVVVVELLLGVVIGPQGLSLVESGGTLRLLGLFGVGFLFFFAGYEIDFAQIRGRPLRLGIIGWLISLGLS